MLSPKNIETISSTMLTMSRKLVSGSTPYRPTIIFASHFFNTRSRVHDDSNPAAAEPAQRHMRSASGSSAERPASAGGTALQTCDTVENHIMAFALRQCSKRNVQIPVKLFHHLAGKTGRSAPRAGHPARRPPFLAGQTMTHPSICIRCFRFPVRGRLFRLVKLKCVDRQNVPRLPALLCGR